MQPDLASPAAPKAADEAGGGDAGGALFAALRGAGGHDDGAARDAEALVAALPRSALAGLRDAEGHSPAHWAALRAADEPGRRLLAALLAAAPALAAAQSAAPAQAGQLPLHWAAVGGHPRAVRMLLHAARIARCGDGAGRGTPAEAPAAAQEGKAGDADPAAAAAAALDARGATPAAHAVHYGHLHVLHMLTACNPLVAEMPDAEGHTLLHWAAHLGHLRIVVYLLRVRGVDPNVRNNSRATPLHLAAFRDEDAVVRFLLRHGADPTLADDQGRTPIQRCDSHETRSHRALRTFQLEMPRLSLAPVSSLTGRARAYAPPSTATDRGSNWAGGVHLRTSANRLLRRLRAHAYVTFYHVVAVISCERYYNLIMRVDPRSTIFTIVLHVLAFIQLISCNMACFCDPGFVPLGSPQELVSAMDDALDMDSFERTFSSAEYCFLCLAPRPPRSKHSHRSGRCIMRFDHFCPWVNADIGLRNHHALLVFPIATVFAQWLFLLAASSVIRKDPTTYTLMMGPLQRYPVLSILILIHFTLSIFAAGLVVTQTKLICTGFTTVEYMVFQKMNDPHNPYNNGCWRNLVSFLTMTGPGTEVPDPKVLTSPVWPLLSRTSRNEQVSDVEIPFIQGSGRNREDAEGCAPVQ